MKGTLGQFLRGAAMPIAGMVVLGALAVGCGDKTSNPDAVTISDLKAPGALKILDKGNGKVTLQWSGVNNESDFDGYNIYGMKGKATDFGLKEGQSLQLLDKDGNANQAARDVLAKFDYDPATTKITAKATVAASLDDTTSGSATTPAAASTDTPTFSARPIHKMSAATPTDKLLPTCKAVKGVCTLTTDATKDKNASDSNYAVNGTVTFDLTQTDTLEVGSSYCFLILSSMKGGTKVSQTSSNLACVTPRYDTSFQLSIPSTSADAKKFDLDGWRAACDTAKTCADPTTGTTPFITADAGYHNAEATGQVYIEQGPALVAGQNNALADLGYYTGFDDPKLSTLTPTVTLDTLTYTNGAGTTAPIMNKGGYSIAGQSVPIVANHMYVLAVHDGTSTTSFHYYWLYVNGTVTAGQNVTAQMRVPKNVDE